MLFHRCFNNYVYGIIIVAFFFHQVTKSLKGWCRKRVKILRDEPAFICLISGAGSYISILTRAPWKLVVSALFDLPLKYG